MLTDKLSQLINKWPSALDYTSGYIDKACYRINRQLYGFSKSFRCGQVDAISGATGLTFTPDGLAIRVGLADPVAAAATPRPARKRSPFVATMPFTAPDGRQFTIMFRPNDLPEEMVEAILAQKAAYIEQLRAAYATPQPKAPTTKPATTTRPATKPTKKPAPTTRPAS